MTTANESKLGGARGGHRGPIVLRVAAARVLPLLPVAARGARLVLSMGLAAGCVRARSSSSPLRGGHCPPLAASTSRLEVWLRCSVHVGCGTPLFRRVVGCRRPARVREGHAEHGGGWQALRSVGRGGGGEVRWRLREAACAVWRRERGGSTLLVLCRADTRVGQSHFRRAASRCRHVPLACFLPLRFFLAGSPRHGKGFGQISYKYLNEVWKH